MLIVFGTTFMELRFDTQSPAKDGISTIADSYTTEPGGRGANQALAACRAGGKVALVSKVGDDDYATNILNTLRREGITTSGIAKTKTPTGCILYITPKDAPPQHTIAFCANHEIESDQVPDEILSAQSVILLQTDLPAEKNEALLNKAKEEGATTVMNLSPSIDLSQKSLKHLDYLIVNHEEARELALKLGLKASQDAIKIAQALATEGQLTCIITLGKDGSIAVTKEGKAWKVGVIDVDVVDKTGAEDVYSGTFAAAIYTGLPLERAIKRASIAASISCTKNGGQTTFPHLGDIEDRLDDLPDAEEIEL